MTYPQNVCVHGNGFIQIDLGGQPETRIHIFHRELDALTQQVNTRHHNHRFGFVSVVLTGCIENVEEEFTKLGKDEECSLPYHLYQAQGERLPTGNRPLVKQPGLYKKSRSYGMLLYKGETYYQQPKDFHLSRLHTEFAATLMTKTTILETFEASIMCRDHLEPDQEYDRFQIPWNRLLKDFIKPVLAETPFDTAKIFRWEDGSITSAYVRAQHEPE